MSTADRSTTATVGGRRGGREVVKAVARDACGALPFVDVRGDAGEQSFSGDIASSPRRLILCTKPVGGARLVGRRAVHRANLGAWDEEGGMGRVTRNPCFLFLGLVGPSSPSAGLATDLTFLSVL